MQRNKESFYNLRLPDTLARWTNTFEKSERSQILRAFIAVMISLGGTSQGRNMVRSWANGQRKLMLDPPGYFKGIVVPPTIMEEDDARS